MYKIAIFLVFLLAAAAFFFRTNENRAPDEIPLDIPLEKASYDPALFSYWKEFKSEKGHFSVSFPSEPHYAKDFVAIEGTDLKRKYEIYAADKLDGTAFMVSVITYPKDFDTNDFQSVLKEVIDEMVKRQEGNRLVKSKATEHITYPSSDFQITQDPFKILGKAIAAGKAVYLLTYISTNENTSVVDYQHFVDSFQIIEPQI